MRNIRRLFLIISILLFGWLFFQIANEIDLIPNYSRTFVSEDIDKVEKFKDLNELKEFSKSKIYSLQKINMERSDLADKQLIMIFILIGIQLFLYITSNKSKYPTQP
ncbi:hypothetical protein PFY12_13305 [Chryseobacterium camelliae]|uniref:Uncharacterized protein n=1 Tax=Chryseobacterium camelliae TaxID=1265445 RepID=A0ABY7QKY3_9FLAO|nr:hypothetical protein [Chryseobacterium camelliae]WBV60009.1 hypothetical protein PFY12_13305 [Chryseobacterium camelliae]